MRLWALSISSSLLAGLDLCDGLPLCDLLHAEAREGG
jgi:hypothetical protein